MSILQSDITSEQPVFAIYYDFFLKFLYFYFPSVTVYDYAKR